MAETDKAVITVISNETVAEEVTVDKSIAVNTSSCIFLDI